MSGRSFAEKTRRIRLANGAVILLLPNGRAATVSVRLRIRAGAYLDGDRPGLAEAAADMLARGTETRTKAAIAADLEAAGSARAWGGEAFDAVCAGACLPRHLSTLLATITEELRLPAFDDEELVKLKGEMKVALLEEAESTTRTVFAGLSRAVFPEGHPFRVRPLDERERALTSLTPQDLRAFHRARYAPAGLVIAAVGRFDEGAVADEITRAIGEMDPMEATPVEAPRVAPAPSREIHFPMKDKPSIDIVIGNAGGIRRGDSDFYPAILANAVLGQSGLSSRLGREVRDAEGLTYSIVSRFFAPSLLDGLWGILLSVAPENFARSIASSQRVLLRFHEEGITARELEIEKSAAAGRYLISLATSSGIAEALVQSESLGLGVAILDEYPERMKAVTLEDANRALRAHIDPGRLVTVSAGSL